MRDSEPHSHSHHAEHTKPALDPAHHSLRDYVPLLVVFGFIALSSGAHVSVMGNSFDNWMMSIMGYFFLFFALFKIIDLPGFTEGFAHYDLIAQRLRQWGFLYPFVELALGLLYLLNVQSSWLHLATIAITLLNVVSVAVKLAKKEAFMCACLGTVLKVPLTTVTLAEYGLMGLMALLLLI